MYKYTIIVPCYNIADKARGLISMLESDRDDVQLIFVDDCSKDNTFSSLKKMAEESEHVVVVQTDHNGGPGVARNKALDLAQGKYILFCDADDRMDLSILEDIDTFLLDVNHDVDMIVFPYSIERKGKSGAVDNFKKYNSGEQVAIVDVAADFGMLFARVFRNDIIQENELRMPERRTGEDKCFMIMYLVHTKTIYKMSRVYYTYVMNKGSITHKRSGTSNQLTTFEVLKPMYEQYFPSIVEKMFAENYLITKAKWLYMNKAKLREIKEWCIAANKMYPRWIKKIDYNGQNLYRKILYYAISKNCAYLIKLVMWMRTVLY